MIPPAGTRRLSTAVRLIALGLGFLAILTLAAVSIVQVYNVIFKALLSPGHFTSAAVVAALFAAAIPAGYLVTNTLAFCGIAVRRCCEVSKRSNE